MFRMVFPSIIRSSRLYIQQQAYVKQILLLLASRNEMELFLYYICIYIYIYTYIYLSLMYGVCGGCLS